MRRGHKGRHEATSRSDIAGGSCASENCRVQELRHREPKQRTDLLEVRLSAAARGSAASRACAGGGLAAGIGAKEKTELAVVWWNRCSCRTVLRSHLDAVRISLAFRARDSYRCSMADFCAGTGSAGRGLQQ